MTRLTQHPFSIRWRRWLVSKRTTRAETAHTYDASLIPSPMSEQHQPLQSDTRPLVTPRRTVLAITLIWLALRLITWAWLVLVAPLRPLTTREQQLPIWPPATDLNAWLERVFMAPFERRDTIYYIWIVARGYRTDDGTAQFHPLLAWLATPLAWLGPLPALLLVSSLAALACLIVFERLARLDLTPEAAFGATLLLAFAPPAFVLFVPYTEGLFLLCAALCLLWMRQRRWWLAGLAGGFATLTRQQGVLLVLPLAWELWEVWRRETRRQGDKETAVDSQQSAVGTQNPGLSRDEGSKLKTQNWLSLALIPAGLLLWLGYRARVLNDMHLGGTGLQQIIYSLLVSPSANKVVPQQALLFPPYALWLALQKLFAAPEYSLVIDLVLAGIFLVMTAFAWPAMRTSYRIYTVAVILLSFAYYTGPFFPYMGLPRHLLLALPVFIGLGSYVATPRRQRLVVVFGLLGMLFLLLQYAIHGWVP